MLVVGFGTPSELIEGSRLGFEVVGLDRDRIATRDGRLANCETVLTDAQEGLPFRKRAFDMVICHHVIEHMNDPESFVEDAANVLTERGCLIIETPDIRFNRHFFDDSTHVTPFTKASMETLIGKYLRLETSQLLAPIWLIWRWTDIGLALPNVFNLRASSVLVIGRKEGG